MPTNTNSPPTQRLNQVLNQPAAASRLLIRAVDQATSKFQIVPFKSKITPRIRNASGFDAAPDATNCGRNARKNSATLGLRTLVRKPWKNMPRIEVCRLLAETGKD